MQDVSITDLKFGREFELAVERKQVAQQDAERARFIVEKASQVRCCRGSCARWPAHTLTRAPLPTARTCVRVQDKLSIIIRAQGEAKAAEMIGKAIASNPGFVQLRRLDVAK
ncbi:hypothetical protein EON67_08985, partial [archaeon]